jgi:hypothetical protein
MHDFPQSRIPVFIVAIAVAQGKKQDKILLLAFGFDPKVVIVKRSGAPGLLQNFYEMLTNVLDTSR